MRLERSVGTCQENVSLNEMRVGMTMFQRVCLKMTITNFYGTSVCEQTMKLGRGKSCQIIAVAIPEDGRMNEKEDEKVEKY